MKGKLLFRMFSPWRGEKDEELKDKRVKNASEEAERVKDKILVLAEAYRADGLVLRQVAPPRKTNR